MARDGKPVELPLTQDFFVDPRKKRLPSRYGDDRVLCFQRAVDAVVVSWDVAPERFAPGLTLELVTAAGRLLDSRPVTEPAGLQPFDGLPADETVVAQLAIGGRLLARGTPVVLPSGVFPPAPPVTVTVARPSPAPAEPRAVFVAEEVAWPDAPEAAPVETTTVGSREG